MTDERPRPQYGEYASPEQQAAAMGTPSPAHATPAVAPALPAAAPVVAIAPNRPWDRILTFALLAYGLYSVISGFFQYRDLGGLINQVYELQGVGRYTSTGLTATLGTVIIISNVIFYLAGALLATRLLRRGRIAFWAPLTAGVAAGIVAGSCMVALMLGDPTFVEYVNGLS